MLKLFPFLLSTRFHALVLIGLAIWLGSLGWIPEELVAFIKLIGGGHIGIRSWDRASEYLGDKPKK